MGGDTWALHGTLSLRRLIDAHTTRPWDRPPLPAGTSRTTKHSAVLDRPFSGARVAPSCLAERVSAVWCMCVFPAGVVPWTFGQHQGDAVFIPGGCPHQVRNLMSCTKVGPGRVAAHAWGHGVCQHACRHVCGDCPVPHLSLMQRRSSNQQTFPRVGALLGCAAPVLRPHVLP